MSEDLVQSAQHEIGRFRYLRLGSTTINQLRQRRIVKGSVPAESGARKPDGIIFLPMGGVKAVVEIKPPSELTAKKLPKVIDDYAPIAAAVCNVLVVTDGQKSFWINPHTKNPILDQDGSEVREVFDPKLVESGKLEKEMSARVSDLIDLAAQSLDDRTDRLEPVQIVDPSRLAQTVWQKIWINTGKEPEKCLYNVVEIFLFKFLSDTGVLTQHYSFSKIVDLVRDDPSIALEHYARMSRARIRKLFPEGPDGTTVINGTIFVNEKGDPNLSQAPLFAEVISEFQSFDDEFGSMRTINREFKTRLYESFLRQQAGVKALGQFFTPRNIVRAIVAMSGARELSRDARICDPFCGVGGFLLETIVDNPQTIQRQFEPSNGRVRPSMTIRGFDKGTDEKEDERTVILAKANMLIYFSDLLARHNSEAFLEELSRNAINDVFRLVRSNLGTFGLTKEEPFDLILTNPPYVSSGSASLKNYIEASGLAGYYEPIGRGTEALAIQWIVKNLRAGGKAFIVVPDGLMNQASMLAYVKEWCEVNLVAALPSRAFFSTPKKTYVLGVTKKFEAQEQQAPVLAYLVSEIGESRDSRRVDIAENDLPGLVKAFNEFRADRESFSSNDPRCKVLEWREFEARGNWLVDRLWSREEKVALGLEDESTELNELEFRDLVDSAVTELSGLVDALGGD